MRIVNHTIVESNICNTNQESPMFRHEILNPHSNTTLHSGFSHDALNKVVKEDKKKQYGPQHVSDDDDINPFFTTTSTATTRTTSITESHASQSQTDDTITKSILSTTASTVQSELDFFDVERLIQIRSIEIERIVQCYSHMVASDTESYNSTESEIPKRDRSLGPTNETSTGRTEMYANAKDVLKTHNSDTHATTSVTSLSTTIHTTTILVVTGPTGSGKTKLIQYALQDRTIQQGGYYIRGTFDVVQHPDPYRAFTMAFTDYTHQVMQRGHDAILKVQNTILTACGNETNVLTQIIPALSILIDYKYNKDDNIDTLNYETLPSSADGDIIDSINSNSTPTTTTSNDAIQRFAFAFQNFTRAISSLEEPVVLVMDDLQYADDCSVDIFCSILKDLQTIPGLFVISTYSGTDLDYNSDDADASRKNTYFADQMREMERASGNTIIVQTIPITFLDIEQIQLVLGQTPKDSPDDDYYEFCLLVRRETEGNIYLMINFLRWLIEQHLLTSNSANNDSVYRSGTWDLEYINQAIQSHKVRKDDGRAICDYYLLRKLESLPTEVIEVLKVGACLGSSHLEASLIENILDVPVNAIVSELIDLGILVALGDGKHLRFVHEMMQTSVYNLIPKINRSITHFDIGRSLWHRLDRDQLDRYVFVVLSQLYQGRQLLTDATERHALAALCLHAGRKAAKASSFRISLFYLNFGIELLGDDGWISAYDLTLSVYNAAVEMEMCTANYEGMELRMAPILKNARCIDDTIQVRTTAVYAYGVSDRQQEAIDLGVEILSDLGFGFPKKLNVWTLLREMNSVLTMLKKKSDEYIKRLPMIEDSKVLASLQVLNMMYLPSMLVGKKMTPYISFKMMKITLTYGLSFVSPVAFCTFGMISIKVFPTTDIAYRCGQLSLELLDRFQVREYLPRVYASYYGCVHPWKYPLHESLDHFIHGYHVGTRTGDIEFACLCANLWSFTAMDTDIPLDKIELQWTNFQTNMKLHRQQSSFIMSTTSLKLVQYYQGKDVDFTETDKLVVHKKKNNLVTTKDSVIWLGRAKKVLLFEDVQIADELASLCYGAEIYRFRKAAPPSLQLVLVPFYNGMISFIMAAQCKRDATYRPLRTRKQYIREGKNMIRLLEKYVAWAPANYIDKQLLLEAELAALQNKSDQAMKKYVCAIHMSKSSGNLFIQGLANERAGRYCYTTLKQSDQAKSFFSAALEVFNEWAAYRKCDALREEMTNMFGTI